MNSQNNEIVKETNVNCPDCEILFEEKTKLQEIEDVNGVRLFRCNQCKVMFELQEYDTNE